MVAVKKTGLVFGVGQTKFIQKNVVDQDGKVFVSLCSRDLFPTIIKRQYIIGNLKYLKRRKKLKKIWVN